MAQNLKYRLGYQKCSPPWECWVKDSGRRHIDFDHRPLVNLTQGTYTMGPFSTDCLIQKFQDRGVFKNYTLLKNFRHPNIVSVENCYEEFGQPRIVLSWTSGSLTAWLKTDGAGKIFKSTMKGSAPTGAMKQMILDLCRGLQGLMDEKLYPITIGKQDIYVYQLGNRAIPQLLVSQVEKLSNAPVAEGRKTKLWAEMRTALKDICKEAPSAFDPTAQEFLDLIGVMSITKLQNYPHQWDYTKKARFLLTVMSENISSMVQALNIKWPETSNGRLCSPLFEMIEHEAKSPDGRTYNVKDPIDYLRLCKNMIKHWRVVPASVKAHCPTVEHFINKMEKWTPRIWCLLYVATA